MNDLSEASQFRSIDHGFLIYDAAAADKLPVIDNIH
jgi:hypothetical protein